MTVTQGDRNSMDKLQEKGQIKEGFLFSAQGWSEGIMLTHSITHSTVAVTLQGRALSPDTHGSREALKFYAKKII